MKYPGHLTSDMEEAKGNHLTSLLLSKQRFKERKKVHILKLSFVAFTNDLKETLQDLQKIASNETKRNSLNKVVSLILKEISGTELMSDWSSLTASRNKVLTIFMN